MSKKHARQLVDSGKQGINPNIIIGILLFAVFVATFLVRVLPNYNYIFPEGWIRFFGADSYYHMRVIENLVANFPRINEIDPYLLYPEPMAYNQQTFFDYLVAIFIKIFNSERIAVFIPPFLASLTIIPVYFIGKLLFNKWAGLIGASLAGLMANEFFGRSVIGSVDHHVLEALLVTVIALFVVLALKNGHEMKRMAVYSLVAGICLAFYLNTWIGGLILVGILWICFVIMFIMDYVKDEDSSYLYHTGVILFVAALFISFLLQSPVVQVNFYLIVSLILMIFLYWLSKFMRDYKLKSGYYLSVILGIGIVGMVVMYLFNRDMMSYILSSLEVILPTGARLTIEEANPLFFPNGNFSLDVAWVSFTTCGILALAGLYLVIRNLFRQYEKDKLILVVWSIVMLLLVLSMRRFVYYYAINVAILAGYVGYLIFELFTIESKRKKAMFSKQVSAVMVFFIVLFPNLIYVADMMNYKQFSPSNAWHETAEWLKSNTPEPYNNTYYNLYKRPFQRLETSYGIVSHWDYGYWITQMAHRSPIINPGITESRGDVARFMLGKENIYSVRDSKYLILTYETAMPFVKFYSWLEYAGLDWHDYYDFYITPEGQEVLLFHVPYYESMIVHLYNFDGQRVIGKEPLVIRYNDNKRIIDGKKFNTYYEANEYVKTQSENCRIVGIDPFISPVSLQELNDYKLVLATENRTRVAETNRLVSEVKVFERVK